MKEKLTKLLNVKSLVTLILTLVFSYLSIIQVINGGEFKDIFLMIMSFYFGTQAKKD